VEVYVILERILEVVNPVVVGEEVLASSLEHPCLMADVEGMSYKEIAEVLEISEEQVKVNIFRARQAIKTKFKQLDDYGL